MVKAACADTIRATLVLLHLLKRQPERISEVGLRHAKHEAAHPHTATDVLVSSCDVLHNRPQSFEKVRYER